MRFPVTLSVNNKPGHPRCFSAKFNRLRAEFIHK